MGEFFAAQEGGAIDPNLFVRKAGDAMTGALVAQNASFVIRDTSQGFLFGNEMASDGGWIRLPGSTIRLRNSIPNQQPQIEDNNGGNARDILDANNGVRKAGDTMTGVLNINVPLLNRPALQVNGGHVHSTDGTFVAQADGTGFMFGSHNATEGGLYRSAGRLRLRCPFGNAQPQIEDNLGGGARDIIDTRNGDLRYVPRLELDAALARIAELEARLATLEGRMP